MGVYLDKKTNRFYIEFQHRGERYKERLGDGITRKDAERLELAIKADLMFAAHGITTKRTQMTFERFVVDHFERYAEANYTEITVDKALYVCKAAAPFFKGKALRSIKPADVERFKTSRMQTPTIHGTPRKPATVLREMSILSKIFSLAVRNDLMDYNPCSRIDKPHFDNIQDRVLSRDDEAALFANMHGEWAKDVCRLALNTGLRQADILDLTRFQVDRAARLISLIQGKTKRRVVVALNDTALEIIERRWKKTTQLLFASPKSGKRASPAAASDALERACRRAGVPKVTIRDLRRTFATRGIENGADVWTVADALGHTSLRMIPRYVRSVENKRKMVEGLEKKVRKVK